MTNDTMLTKKSPSPQRLSTVKESKLTADWQLSSYQVKDPADFGGMTHIIRANPPDAIRVYHLLDESVINGEDQRRIAAYPSDAAACTKIQSLLAQLPPATEGQ